MNARLNGLPGRLADRQPRLAEVNVLRFEIIGVLSHPLDDMAGLTAQIDTRGWLDVQRIARGEPVMFRRQAGQLERGDVMRGHVRGVYRPPCEIRV